MLGSTAQVFSQEIGHKVRSLDGLGKRWIVPERVWQPIEDDEACVHAGIYEGAMQIGGTAQQVVAAASNEKRRRQSAQVGVDRRQNRILGIRRSYVIRSVRCTRR